MFITKKHLPRRTVLKGVGATLALPLLESMIPARTLLAQTAANPSSRLGFVYVPHGAVMAQWTPATEGAGFEFTRILKPLEPFRDSPERRQRPRAQGGRHDRRPFAEPHDVAERRPPETDAGRRRVCRRDRGSDRRAADRPGHHAAVDRARHRGSLGADRRLRSRLRLHLHEHAVVADADDAAADGDQSAEGLRADVRPGRQRRRPARANAAGPQHSRCDHRAGGRSAAQAGPARSRDGRPVSRERSRDRTASSDGRQRETSRPNWCCPRRRPAFRFRTKST